MFSTDDTIAAIATPAGRGAIGVIRISGPASGAIADAILSRRAPLEPRVATLTHIRSTPTDDAAAPRRLDQVVATRFPAPASYTGQDVLELTAHGSPVVLASILRAAVDAGARLARPGEFTLRAFLAGKMDLVQAEAVADLIAAATPLQARVAFDQLEGTLTGRIATIDATLFDLVARLEASLDFPDEGYHFIEAASLAESIRGVADELEMLLRDAGRGRLIREGATVVIAGRPNVGKSSLFNALVGADRAIVTEVPGTTRDLVTERIDIGGIAVTLVDTAGARDAEDAVEREGVVRGVRARDVADLVIVVLDSSRAIADEDLALLEQVSDQPIVVVANKSDRPNVLARDVDVRVSAMLGEGLATLRTLIETRLTGGESFRDTAAISNMRHVVLLQEALQYLSNARKSALVRIPEEFVLADLQAARGRFEEIVGARTSDDVLQHIFERFCIGK